MDADDKALWQRWAAQHDADALRDLTARYSGMVYGACRRIVGNAAAAADVTRACFETLVQADIGPDEYVGAWLHREATNRSQNRIEALRPEARETEEQLTSSRAEWDRLAAHIDRAINALPEKSRIPVVAYFLDLQSQDAIAKALGISRQAVPARIQKGIEGIRKSLRRRGVSVEEGALADLMQARLDEAVLIPAPLKAALDRLAADLPAASAVHRVLPAAGARRKRGRPIAQVVSLVVVLVVAASFAGWWVTLRKTPTDQAVIDSEKLAVADEAYPTVSDQEDRAPSTPAKESAASPSRTTTSPKEGAIAPGIQRSEARTARACLVTGRVVYAETDQPVREFQIGFCTQRPQSGLKASIDAQPTVKSVNSPDGTFSLVGLPHGTSLGIVARAPGCTPAVAWIDALPPDVHKKGVTLRLEPGGAVEGTVVDTQGRSVAGAAIYIGSIDEESVFMEGGLVRTEEDGAFRLEGLPLDTQVVSAYHPEYVVGQTVVRVDPAHATETEIVLYRGGTISGAVSEDGAALMANIAVQDVFDGHVPSADLPTDAEGRYTLERLHPGEVKVTAIAGRDNGVPRHMAKNAVVEEGKVTYVDFDFKASARIEGTVLIGDRPAVDCPVHIAVDTIEGSWEEAETQTDDAGHYRFVSVPAGSVTLKAYGDPEASGPPGIYTFEAPAHVVTRQDVHLATGGAIAGTVSNIRPEEQAAIIIVEGLIEIDHVDAEFLGLFDKLAVAQADLDAGGSFRVDGLQPGTYTVLAGAWDTAYGSDEEIVNHGRYATAVVEVSEGSESLIDLAF